MKEEQSFRQKVRLKRAKKCDANTRFYHQIVNARRRKSEIKELELDWGRVERDKELIRHEITEFYHRLYTEEEVSRPFIGSP